MSKHYETRAAAIQDLLAHGFRELKNGNWVNEVCAAQILLHAKAPVVAVQYWAR